MKRKLTLLIVTVLVMLMSTGIALAQSNNQKDCTTIQSGEINYSDNHYLDTVHVGYDIFGYNYQAHMFKGSYANVYLGGNGYPPYNGDDEAYYQRLVEEGYADNETDAETMMDGKWYWSNRNIELKMKWNDPWISNKDCDGDGLLDRHYGHDSYIGSGAWLTNQMKGGDGKDKWTYFTKIVAVPKDATTDDGNWYTADGSEIGPVIWGQFVKVQTVESGYGATYVSPSGPGLGLYK
ncbi:hypothetical protein [Methanohalobium sp.]|uniref:hypothetical protein n=1 Tax=Methanohalobium sp. TaxID=2837493 RepID=UPI0025E48391|nr:hypothetical protein [Methanohalobium sp.]